MRLIDADALRNELISLCSDKVNAYNKAIYAFIEFVDSAPTVERPQGEWIEHYDNSDGFTWLTCSRCMFKVHEEGYNFCPNCGADMRKEAEDDTP